MKRNARSSHCGRAQRILRPGSLTAVLSKSSGRSWDALSEDEEYRVLCRERIEHVVRVREPLVLVSQIQRSGGTLLSQLFDGHPECHAHPHELATGYPKSQHWPQLDLADPSSWYPMLYEKYPQKHFRLGYQKPAERHGSDEIDVFPFLFLPRLQKAIFDAAVAGMSIDRPRQVFDCYFTSYFNAWLDNHNLYTGPKRVVTAFAPRLVGKAASVAGLVDAYPDGFLVSIVRDPCAWYASVRKQAEHYQEVEPAVKRWRMSTEAALDARERYPDRVVVITYEELVQETEATMRRLADVIGISMSPILLEPTFNGRPIRANSSDSVRDYGVVADRTTAYRKTLELETIAQVQRLAGDLYERAASPGPRAS
jgi:Sulfotransferase family